MRLIPMSQFVENVEIGQSWPLMTSDNLTFDLTLKLTELVSSYLYMLFWVPLTTCRYMALEPSWGLSMTPRQVVEDLEAQKDAG